jgi:hypothetical protein
MDNSPTPPEPQVTEIIDQRRPQTSWVKYAAFAAVGVVAIGCATYLYKHTLETPERVAGKVGDKVEGWTGKFGQWIKTLSETIVSSDATMTVGQVRSGGSFIVASEDLSGIAPIKWTGVKRDG